MDTGSATIWQVAAGDTNHSYCDVCLDWDVICFGPGSSGSWPGCKAKLENDGWSTRKIGQIRRFHEEIENGDFVVLRLGTSHVYGVGQVVDKCGEPCVPLVDPVDCCSWNDHFGDVDGWDLQFVRRVRWLWDYRCHDREPKVFKTYAMKFGDTVQKLSEESCVRRWIDDLEVAQCKRERNLVDLPQSGQNFLPQVETSKIANHLFDKGVAASSINALTEDLSELQHIASWYRRSPPSEHETVAYLVVPLLRALGWTPQRMAVEWNRMDLALFNRLPREDKNLAVVVEVKRLGHACLPARSQAQYYAEEEGKERDECQRLIVTDGIRYGVYVRGDDGTFPHAPAAYLNIDRMMDCYRILSPKQPKRDEYCGGAAQALELIASDWSREGSQKR